jgi:hypothetical protein
VAFLLRTPASSEFSEALWRFCSAKSIPTCDKLLAMVTGGRYGLAGERDCALRLVSTSMATTRVGRTVIVE